MNLNKNTLATAPVNWARRCRACKQEKPLSKFRLRGGDLKQLDYWCAECRTARHKHVLPKKERKARLEKGLMSTTVAVRMEATLKERQKKGIEHAITRRAEASLARPLGSARIARELLKKFPFPEHCLPWRDRMQELLDEASTTMDDAVKKGIRTLAEDALFWYDVVPGMRAVVRAHVASYPDGQDASPFIIL